MSSPFKGTTICAVKKNGCIAVAGDGQVTMGEHTIFKTTARKVRRLFLRCAKNLKKSCSSTGETWSGQPSPWRSPGAEIRPCGSLSP